MSVPLSHSQRIFHREITSRFEEVDTACSEIRAFLSANNLAAHSFTVELVARELLNNAILHGNRKQADKKVTLSLHVGRRWLRLEIADEGEGFNWRQARATAATPSATSGRGLMIGKLYADRLSFNRIGNRVTLWLDKNRTAKRY
jgi:serine/threonine-protein kinase RsbW